MKMTNSLTQFKNHRHNQLIKPQTVVTFWFSYTWLKKRLIVSFRVEANHQTLSQRDRKWLQVITVSLCMHNMSAIYIQVKIRLIQGQYDKYLASPPDGAIVARQRKGNRTVKLKSTWMLYTVSLLLRWRLSKIGLTSFNVVVRRFSMSHAQVSRKRLPRTIKWLKSTISYWQTADWRYPR